jgi:deoxycytidylate deaminase
MISSPNIKILSVFYGLSKNSFLILLKLINRILYKGEIKVNKKDRRYFKIAKAISKLSKFDKYRVGSILVLKHDVISTGYNKFKTYPKQKLLNHHRFPDDDRFKGHIHSELDCLKKIPEYVDLSNASLYIYRDNTHGIQMSRPCDACMEEIKRRKIKCIYYTDNDGYYKEIIKREDDNICQL